MRKGAYRLPVQGLEGRSICRCWGAGGVFMMGRGAWKAGGVRGLIGARARFESCFGIFSFLGRHLVDGKLRAPTPFRLEWRA